MSQSMPAVGPSHLRTVCGWCDEVMEEGPTDEKGRSSHGICPACVGDAKAGKWAPKR